MQEANKSGNYGLGVTDKYSGWEGDFSTYALLTVFDFLTMLTYHLCKTNSNIFNK